MYKVMNGWTKEQMIESIRKFNTGEKSTFSGSACAYEDPSGNNHCGVGCFIKEKEKEVSAHYNFKKVVATKNGILALLDEYPQLSNLMPINFHGLALLQFVHDKHSKNAPESVKTAMINWIKDNVK